MNWQTTDPAVALTAARYQLHAAGQLVTAVGYSLLAPEADDSHTSLVWDGAYFSGRLILAAVPFRAGLEPITLTLLLLDEAGKTLASLPLVDRTLAEGLAWLKQAITQLAGTGARVALGECPPALLGHALAEGVPFIGVKPPVRQELVRYFTNTDLLLQAIATTGSPVLVWPHNFDIAVLISLDGGAKTIGVGLSPGDTSYNQPYWYITAWPYPPPPLPILAGQGFWHTEGWVGAVLTASQLACEPFQQEEQVRSFIDSAVGAAKSLLG
ncbi:hypothetical protein [Anthocerotibacter panamensis]|uniref:hypothetical protein n=1 Tax=Anthocerotibacter panamensis TaxID=2857077 RepID=UPI001C40487A|nr:hypothetical protein [Anthocerotibacter panamensis]